MSALDLLLSALANAGVDEPIEGATEYVHLEAWRWKQIQHAYLDARAERADADDRSEEVERLADATEALAVAEERLERATRNRLVAQLEAERLTPTSPPPGQALNRDEIVQSIAQLTALLDWAMNPDSTVLDVTSIGDQEPRYLLADPAHRASDADWEREGHWEPAPDCDKLHYFDQEGWRPGATDVHEHWVED